MDFQVEKKLPPAIIIGRIEREVMDSLVTHTSPTTSHEMVASPTTTSAISKSVAIPAKLVLASLAVKSGQAINLLGGLNREGKIGGVRVVDTEAVGRELENLDRNGRKMLPGKHCPEEKMPRSMVGSNDTMLNCLENTDELVEHCSPLWHNLATEGRSRYSRESREALGWEVVREGLDSYGRPLKQIVNRAMQEGIEKENMKASINSKVDRAQMNQKVEGECFYIPHTNAFCLPANGGEVSDELFLARMTLRKGLEEIYHKFIEPGFLPEGYRVDCTEIFKAIITKMPLDLALCNGNYKQIVNLESGSITILFTVLAGCDQYEHGAFLQFVTECFRLHIGSLKSLTLNLTIPEISLYTPKVRFSFSKHERCSFTLAFGGSLEDSIKSFKLT